MSDMVEFYKGKNIFITGGSGFIGKALIEKLLRAFPEIGCIYVLIRKKKGKSPYERIEEILANPIFDGLRANDPSALTKVKPIVGDVEEIRLGISDDDEKLLTSKVNLIFHAAASVRFDDHLKDAIITNVRSTREINQLALKCEHMHVMVHVSTVYCNIDQPVIGEEFYPIDFDWKVAIELAEQDDGRLQVLSQKSIGPMPNTYTFTKRLGEAAAVEICNNIIPLVIVRPSIVIFAIREPIAGWIDNLNGPFTLVSCGLKGVVSILFADREAKLDMVFVDNLVKAMILSAADKSRSSDSEVSVYNATTDLHWSINTFEEQQYSIRERLPHTGRLCHTSTKFTQSWYTYYLQIIFTHVTVALLVDTILRATGKKPMLLKIIRRIYLVNDLLLFFMKHTISIENVKYLALHADRLNYDKRNEFEYQIDAASRIGVADISYLAMEGMKKFIFHEPVPVLEETHKNTFRLYILSQVFKICSLVLVLYLVLCWKFNLINVIATKITKYVENL